MRGQTGSNNKQNTIKSKKKVRALFKCADAINIFLFSSCSCVLGYFMHICI